MPTDRRVAKRMFRIVKENCKELPSVFAEVIDKRFGGDTDAYVDYLYDNSVFADEQRALAAVASGKELKEDPAAVLSESIVGKMRELSKAQKEGRQKYADGHRLYIAGLMRMQPKKAWASDANFTIRLTYGRILPYNPADGIRYNYYTTLKGVMEKENPENPTEFTVPAKLKELYAAKDFGRYANAKGELPTWLPGRLRHHGRQLGIAGAQRQGIAHRTGFRRQLGGDVGRCGLRTRIAAHDCCGCALCALRDRQVRRCGLAARRVAVRIEIGFSGEREKACPAGCAFFSFDLS